MKPPPTATDVHKPDESLFHQFFGGQLNQPTVNFQPIVNYPPHQVALPALNPNYFANFQSPKYYSFD